jgi:hypothetical protein
VSPFRHPPTDLFIVFIVLVERKQSKVFIQAVLNVQQGMAQGRAGCGNFELRASSQVFLELDELAPLAPARGHASPPRLDSALV